MEDKRESPMWLLIILVLVLLAAAVFYFGKNNPELVNGQSPSDHTANRTYTVFYESGVFSPTNIRIHIGDSVRFQNNSSDLIRVTSEVISEVAETPGFDGAIDIVPGKYFAYNFNQVGTFGYHNNYNKNERGTVTVRP